MSALIRSLIVSFVPVLTGVVVMYGPVRGALLLDDPLQGSTVGTRVGGGFVAGGWQVTGKNDAIYWHVATLTEGIAEFDVRGLHPNECRIGMEDKSELFHMYDYTFGNSDINYNGGYRDNPFKHFIRKIGCADTRPGKTNALELLWQTLPNYTEPDSGVLTWDPNATYRFREEWGPDGGGNSVMRIYRDGALVSTMTMPGSWAPAGHSIRIASSTRRSADAGAPIGAVFSNVKVWDSLISTPGPPTVIEPAQNAVVHTPLTFIRWNGDPHSRYEVRVNRTDDPDAGIVWSSGVVVSARNYAWTGPLEAESQNFVFVRLGDANTWGPWSAAARSFTTDLASPPAGPDSVRVQGNSLADDRGPFPALGASYFQALRRAKFDRVRLHSDLDFLASKNFDYVRVLSMVGWYEAWQGLEIAPVGFTNRSGAAVAAWPDYWRQFREMIDIIHGHGMRAQVTIFADAQLMPNKTDRLNHMALLLQNLAGREHKVALLEVANEAWQNGFPGSQGVADLREFTQYLAERTSIPVAITANDDVSEQGIIALNAGTPADIATVHFSRDLGTAEGGWLPVRDCYRAGILAGVPPVSSNEPIGPGSSVSAENDPIKLVMAAAFAWAANLPMYVFHSNAGVFGATAFQNMPGIGDYTHLREILPPDLASWVRNDGRESSAPFTAFANAQADAWWPEVAGATTGVVRNTGATKAGEFVALPIGILNGGVTLQARRPMKFRVYHPITGAVVSNPTLNAGAQITLPRGPGAYIIRGRFLDSGVPLIPQGSVWKYLDNDSIPAATWRTTGFSDAGWPGGAAQLGFGEGDETTVINGGPDNARFITTYFRRAFSVSDPAAFSSLSFRVLRDDGAVVHLNGFELFRSNMPATTIDSDTVASSVVSDADESTFFPHSASTSRLSAGANVLAVEIHQANQTTTDLSFDLAMDGMPVDWPPSVRITHPFNDLVLESPAAINVNAVAYDDDGTISRVEFFLNDSKVGEDTSIPYGITVSGLSTGDHLLTARAVDNVGTVATSAVVRVKVKRILSPTGAVWKFLDNGSNQGIDWRRTDFTDAGWPNGGGEFGYGDGDESTVIGFGGDPVNKFITTYFRRSFAISDPEALVNFEIRLLCDDGATGFLNGLEAFRINMPDDPVNYQTPASVALGGADELTWSTILIDPALFVSGTNVLAVEVHQANAGSSDISFDLELNADFAPPPQVEISRSGNACVLTWPAWAEDFALESSPTLNPASWITVPLPAGQTFFNAGFTTDLMFYRLRRP